MLQHQFKGYLANGGCTAVGECPQQRGGLRDVGLYSLQLLLDKLFQWCCDAVRNLFVFQAVAQCNQRFRRQMGEGGGDTLFMLSIPGCNISNPLVADEAPLIPPRFAIKVVHGMEIKSRRLPVQIG